MIKVVQINRFRGGGVDDSIFEKMLSDAIRENKNSEILFKIHPDTLETKAAIKISKELLDQVTILSNPINPIALIQQIDVIYVATSQMGFEGLLCGKEVHTYGMPFYAGWGLTIDKMHCNRRLRKLTLDELFYITYIKYTHYINHFTGNEDSLENTLKYLVNLKKQLKIY